MLNVVCWRWGGWPAYYVNRLRNGVARHMTVPHRFICFTDDPAGIDGDIEIRPILEWRRRNFTRLRIFGPATGEMAGIEGRILVIDLDHVVTGNLDDIARYAGRLGVIGDFYDPGHCGGGMYSFEAGDLADILYHPLTEQAEEDYGGYERHWMRDRANDIAEFWQDLFPGQVVTYKPWGRPHLEAVPDGARMVCFHGRPKPHDVDHPWLREHWR